MTLRQTLQAAPTKTKDLLERLAGTSNQAVKTRENLLGELRNELALYVELEEQHLLPELRKNAETKTSAADAVKAHKELRQQLSDLAAAALDSDEFREKASQLSSTFEQHLVSARKAVPALLKGLDGEGEEKIAAGVEATLSEAEAAERETKRVEAAVRKAERESAEQAAVAEEAARRAERAAARKVGQTAERAVDSVSRGVSVAEDSVRRVAGSITTQAQNAAQSARQTLTTYGDTVCETGSGLQTLGKASGAALSVVGELRSAWMGWARKSVRANIEATQQLLKCRSVRDVAELQRNVVGAQMLELLEGSRQVLQITERTARSAAKPLDNRLAEPA